MKRARQIYYDLFSKVYDNFVALHSSDKVERLREWFIVRSGIKPGMKILDLCAGTGSVALKAKKAMGKGLVVGLDFSEGMLKRAKNKAGDIMTLSWIRADAIELPFKDKSFDIVLCAYAFYELKDRQKLQAMSEIKRVLVNGGRFCMMEHEEPSNPLIKFLYRVRIASMGSWDSIKFVKKELDLINSFFEHFIKEKSPSGNSKLIIAVKD